ncbi:ATP-dependent helicase [Metabacillus sp. GX 13764]|uniref:ATP-dependent helicase n=1 Tax=Metabacillus kandeliae TaxID=2900151 RepID=UPI001E56C1BB|nr:ATP-dependent helicase [Metabacillus kandeliae]MCD7035007.1 ATP-dependent helicase [Metabacillus kandeliae]
MFLAKHQEHLINLHVLPREEYQRIYELGQKGKLICPVCGRLLKLLMSITKPPMFIHTGSVTDENCEAKSQSLLKQKDNTREAAAGGFKLPQSRSISDGSQTPSPKWKGPRQAKVLDSFQQANEPSLEVMKGITMNRAQYQAVKAEEQSVLVLAGAGSGKTRTLTARAAYLLREKNVPPSAIMLVTFTVKAAKEMKERMAALYGLTMKELNQIVIGTFHGIFYKMLMHHDRERWDGRNLLKWDWQREQLIKQAGRERGLDEKDFPYDQALQQISFWKNSLLEPGQIKPQDKWEEDALFLYRRYEESKQENSRFDFDDMLVQCLALLRENPDVLEQYQHRFQHFLIDEFQDINKVQYEIMRKMAGEDASVFAVGDDDQSIYAFRGSDPAYLLQFEKDFPGSSAIHLSTNYRSSHAIVASANKVIDQNKTRYAKKMDPFFDNGKKPLFFFPYDEEEEATLIVNDMKEKVANGEKPSDFAVLYRTHTMGRAIFERLSQSSLPFTVEKESVSFYDRRMVKSLLAYLRLSVNPDDVQALGDLLFSLFLKQSVLTEVKGISIMEDCSVLDALLKANGVLAFQKKKLQEIVPLFKTLKDQPPVEAIEAVEKKMGFGDFLKKRGNEGNAMEKGSDDLKDLKVIAKKFTTAKELLEHADHMSALAASVKKDGKMEGDGVRLMTIHRAKGLEFKHVYVLETVDGSIPHDYSLEAARNGDFSVLEEERRLLYVAMTRAKEELLLSVPLYRRGRRAAPSRLLSPVLPG